MNQQSQAMSFKLNTASAKQVGVNSRIDTKGAYTGVITRAEAVTSSKGTAGIEIAFRSDAGQTADYLNLWLVNSEGKELFGRKVLDALMTCLRTQTIAPQQARVKKWDSDANAEVVAAATVYPELMNKPVGLLLVAEEYEKNNGDTNWKMTIVGAFSHDGLMPVEILDRKSQGLLPKVVEQLRDRPLKKKPSRNSGGYGSDYGGADQYAAASGGGGGGFGDEDIPW